MAPLNEELNNSNNNISYQKNELNYEKKSDFENHPIVWKNVLVFTLLHIGALYGLYLCFYDSNVKKETIIFGFILYACGGLGITAGAHRLWAHRTYKAKLPLRLLLGIFQTIALQNSIYEWVRDHRVHHKHSETDADPHNAKRGFFFSHIGWLLMKKHSKVMEKGSKIPLDDLLADPVVYYQKRFYKPLALTFCFGLPTILPVLLWEESLMNSYFISGVLKYVFTLHATWLVNSLAHMIGNRPYDKTLNPAENKFVSLFAFGEGFHNYHHSFPMDYATSEFGSVYLNTTKLFIDLMAICGLAYDRRKVTPEMIIQRRKRTGDLSEYAQKDINNNESNLPQFEHEY